MPLANQICFVFDQIDSILGGLLALSIVVPVPLASWLLVIAVGALIHWAFNFVLMFLGLKTRAA